MAFKILDSEEILLLNDKQRIQYEKELDLYHQRVAFVEHLEMFENVRIESYEPQLEPISDINGIEIMPLKKIEYVMSPCESVKKPYIQIKSHKKIGQILPVLPRIHKHVNVYERNIKKIERERLDIPSFAKPQVMVKSFKQSEKKQAKLPTVIRPSLKIAIPYEQLKNDLHNMPSNVPDIVIPDIDINHIAVPVKQQPHLPNVSVCTTKMITFIKPEKNDTELPIVVKPNITVNCYREKRPIQPNLPEVSTVFSMPKEFSKFEQRKAELPTIEQPDLSVRSFKKPEHGITDFPSIELMSEHFTSKLPPFTSLKVKATVFEKPESVKFEIPAIKPSIKARKLEKIQPKIVANIKPNVIVKEFKRQQGNISKLPVINISEAPNVYSKLKELLPISSEVSGVLRG